MFAKSLISLSALLAASSGKQNTTKSYLPRTGGTSIHGPPFQLTRQSLTVTAITITEPQQGARLDLSGPNTISWTSVNTDPTSFEIVLMAPQNATIADTVIAASVNTADHNYTFSNVVTPVGDSYQISFIGNEVGGANTGIISQSQVFAVTKSGVASTTSATGSTATGTGASASATSSGSSAARGSFGVGFGVTLPVAAAALGMLL
jgi:hypothetical protein